MVREGQPLVKDEFGYDEETKHKNWWKYARNRLKKLRKRGDLIDNEYFMSGDEEPNEDLAIQESILDPEYDLLDPDYFADLKELLQTRETEAEAYELIMEAFTEWWREEGFPELIRTNKEKVAQGREYQIGLHPRVRTLSCV